MRLHLTDSGHARSPPTHRQYPVAVGKKIKNKSKGVAVGNSCGGGGPSPPSASPPGAEANSCCFRGNDDFRFGGGMKNLLRKLHIGEGSGEGPSSPAPLPPRTRKGSGGGGGATVLHPYPLPEPRQQPSVVASWINSVRTRPGEEEGMERGRLSQEDGLPRERRRSPAEDFVERAMRESSEAEEREREEDDLEEFQLQLVLEMSERENEIEVAKQICQKQNDLSHQPCSKESYEDGESSVTSESIGTLLFSLEFSDQATELKTLEGILIDANAKPARLSYPFIRSITRNFSQEIGRGGFGVVYLGHVGSWKVAVKKLSILQGFSDKPFVDEINCLIGTRHNNIVRFLGYCADTHGEFVRFNQSHVMAEVPQRMLCFEYVPGKLQKYLRDKPHKDDWKMQYQMIRGICHGLNYLHNQRIIHLDLKPDNILLDAHLEPKITDFGISRCFDEGISRVYTKTVRGTQGSIAPEVIDSGEITFKSDIYGLGIIIIKILTGRNNYDFENWHTSIDVDDPQVQSCIEIARKCVAFNQHERPTIGEIMQKLDEIERM